MDEHGMSDRSLLLLLTVSFIVAIAGMLFAIEPGGFTGFAVFNVSNANATAQANITIVSNVAISVTGGWDFGEGFVNSTGGGAHGKLQSGGCSDPCGSTDDPYNYTNWTANVNGSGRATVQNVGNINITVRANSNQSPDRWFCNDQQHTPGADHFNNQSLNTTLGTVGNNCISNFTSLTNFSTYNTTAGTLICDAGNLGVSESINVDMAIWVDSRCLSTTGERYTTVTFFGYS